MNKLIIKSAALAAGILVPEVFTGKQAEIIKKMDASKKLSNSERKQWYAAIAPRLRALSQFSRERRVFIAGGGMIPERVEESIGILSSFSEDAFISGSFLFKSGYNDIDVFIFSGKRKEIRKGKLHLSYLPRKALGNPRIQSAARSSVGNFPVPPDYHMPRIGIYDIITLFQEAALPAFEGKAEKNAFRDIIFHHHYLVHSSLLSSHQLLDKSLALASLKKESQLSELRRMALEMLKGYRRSYLGKELRQVCRGLSEDIKKFRLNEHLKFYIETYEGALSA